MLGLLGLIPNFDDVTIFYILWCEGLTEPWVNGYVTITSDSNNFAVFTNTKDPAIFLVGAWLLLLEKALVSLEGKKTGIG